MNSLFFDGVHLGGDSTVGVGRMMCVGVAVEQSQERGREVNLVMEDDAVDEVGFEIVLEWRRMSAVRFGMETIAFAVTGDVVLIWAAGVW